MTRGRAAIYGRVRSKTLMDGLIGIRLRGSKEPLFHAATDPFFQIQPLRWSTEHLLSPLQPCGNGSLPYPPRAAHIRPQNSPCCEFRASPPLGTLIHPASSISQSSLPV